MDRAQFVGKGTHPDGRASQSCPRCGAATVTRRVLEHLPCGQTYFTTEQSVETDSSRDVDRCRKCRRRRDPESVAHRGAVSVCLSCRARFDATDAARIDG